VRLAARGGIMCRVERPDGLVGRGDALAQATRALRAARSGARAALAVTGASGTGKTALLRAALSHVEGVDVAWGTCRDGGAPGYWPWTQALTGLVRTTGLERALRAAGQDAELLATLVPAVVPAVVPAGGASSGTEVSDRGRLLLQDAVAGWLRELSQERPLVVVLDDLQWADESSLDLLRIVVEDPRPAGLCVVAAVRDDEVPGRQRAAVAAVVAAADHVRLGGLDRVSTGRLVRSVAGPGIGESVVDEIHARAGGLPFFTRELALAAREGLHGEVPSAVQDAVLRRIERLSPGTRALLPAAALHSNALDADVLAETAGCARADVEEALAEAAAAGVVVADGRGWRFAHDLFRETLAGTIAAADLPALHLRTAEALERRHLRTQDVPPSELARHYRAGLPLAPVEAAAAWALRAAEADRASVALAEAAQHLRLLRAAVSQVGAALPVDLLVHLLLVEAELLVRGGRPSDARGLLRVARSAADEAGAPELIARSALAVAAAGSRFSARRDEVVQELETALEVVRDRAPGLEARVAAALARELHHSVPEERARAAPLSERALELGRGSADAEVLSACLLARHDILWTPGQAHARTAVAEELVELARQTGDGERLAESLLLQANSLLEAGSAAFAPVLVQCLELLEGLGQPRHRYTVETRRACLALMRGELDEAEELIERAAVLGERVREPDTGNVRMSQRLELTRSRSVPEELVRFAGEAVAHWVGAPVHAHAVAAGFSARAGALDEARHHVAVVRDLGGWQADRSYLWSVFVPELAVAAVALGDELLSRELYDAVRGLAGTCGVNGAVVAFSGAHAHTAGRLAAALGERDRAAALLQSACETYEQLGAAALAGSRAELAAVQRDAAPPAAARMHRRGPVWEISFAGRVASVGDCKGLDDIARLVAREGRDVHVLDLATPRAAASPQPAAERARKAVSARIRDAVQRIGQELPELAAHLDATVITGVRCRYVGELRWDVRR